MVPVAFFRTISPQKIVKMVDADLLLNAMIFSAKRPEYLGSLFKNITDQTLEKIFCGSSSKSNLAQITGFSYNALFPPKK